MSKEQITIEHKAMLEPLLKKAGVPFIEYCFSTLFLFRKKYNYELVKRDKYYITGRTQDKHTFLMFLEKPFYPFSVEVKQLLKEVDFLFPIYEKWLQEWDVSQLEFFFKPEESDYLFTVEKLQQYPGRHLSKKRNLVHQFQELYEVESFPISPERSQDILYIIDQWHQGRDHDDYGSAVEAVKYLKELEYNGRIYYVEGKPVAYIMGENITDAIFDFHFSKCNIEYKGIYQFVYQDFAKRLQPPVEYINMEQDLGLDSLRQAKHSYSPDLILPKYCVSLKK